MDGTPIDAQYWPSLGDGLQAVCPHLDRKCTESGIAELEKLYITVSKAKEDWLAIKLGNDVEPSSCPDEIKTEPVKTSSNETKDAVKNVQIDYSISTLEPNQGIFRVMPVQVDDFYVGTRIVPKITECMEVLTLAEHQVSRKDISMYKTWNYPTMEMLFNFTRVPEFKGREDIGFESRDFTLSSHSAAIGLKLCTTLWEKLKCLDPQTTDPAIELFRKDLLLLSMFLSLENKDEHSWSNGKMCNDAQALHEELLSECSCRDLTHFLCSGYDLNEIDKGINRNILKKIFHIFRTDLIRGRWKNFPSLPYVFRDILIAIRFPHLSEHIGELLPGALLILDDHQLEMRIIAIESLQHITEHCSKSELASGGQAMVIFDAFSKLMYSREPALVEKLHPCMLNILSIVEVSPKNATAVRHWSKYDSVFLQLLTGMEMEDKLMLRRTCARSLSCFIVAMGITTVRHFPRLLRVITSYLEIHDGPEEVARIAVLDSARILIQETWPRIPHHVPTLIKSLVKLLIELEMSDNLGLYPGKDILKVKCREVLETLKRAASMEVTTILEAIQVGDVPEQCYSTIQHVIQSE